jgi:hypothetical protein
MGVWVCAGFFAVGGLLELALTLWEQPQPSSFLPAWEGLGRSLLHGLVALGLWRRLALCRSLAMVYCLAALVTYAAVFTLAFGCAPVEFPTSLIVKSLYEVPSCALILPYLRSPRASLIFTRPLFGRRRGGA